MTRQQLVIHIRDALLNNLRNGDSAAAAHLLKVIEAYPPQGPESEREPAIKIDHVSPEDAERLIVALRKKLSGKYESAS